MNDSSCISTSSVNNIISMCHSLINNISCINMVIVILFCLISIHNTNHVVIISSIMCLLYMIMFCCIAYMCLIITCILV